MKPLILLCAFLVAASGFAADGELTRFEKQLRSDLQTILKAHWPAQKGSADATAYADTWFLELKTSYPDLFPNEAEPTVPTDLQLAMLQEDAAQYRIPKSKGEIWCFYQDNWRRRLSADQKILFGRFLGIVIAEAKKRTSPEADIQRLDPQIQRLEDELHRLRMSDKDRFRFEERPKKEAKEGK